MVWKKLLTDSAIRGGFAALSTASATVLCQLLLSATVRAVAAVAGTISPLHQEQRVDDRFR